MTDTGYNLSEEQAQRVARLHFVDEEGKLTVAAQQEATSGNTIWSGVNGLWSTAADYMKFSRMLMNGGELDGARILSRKTVELMTVNHIGDLPQGLSGPGWGFGLGFGVLTDSAAAGALVSSGTYLWGGAYNTAFFIDPVEDLIGVFMTQTFPSNAGYYSEKLRQLAAQAIVD